MQEGEQDEECQQNMPFIQPARTRKKYDIGDEHGVRDRYDANLYGMMWYDTM